MSAPAESHVYISYNTRDLPFVENLYDRLSQAGLNPWLDRRALVAGDKWRERIAEAVATAYAVVVVLSPNAAASEYVRADIDNARKVGLRIIPVLMADVAPDDNPLADTQWLNFRDAQHYPWDDLINLLERERSNLQPRIDPDAARNVLNAPPPQEARKKAAPQSKRAPRKGGDPVDDDEEDDEQPVVQVAVQSNAPPNNLDPSDSGTPPTPPPPTFPLLGSLRGAGNDRVSDQDQLGFNNYVYAFADLIEARDTTPPLTIGIYGSWGSGKSFLLNSIVRELEKPSAERLKERKTERVVRKVRVIEFNAWEYNATEVIWAGLVRKIIDKLEGDLRLGSLERRARRVRYNFGRHWRQTRGRFFGQVLLMFLLAAALVIGRNWLTGSDIASLSELLIPIVGVGSLLTIANSLREALTSPVSQWLTALFEEGDYGRQIDYMADIREDLQFLEKRLGQAQERVLIIIDDLDRCEPTKAVEVLQAINLLLNFNHFIVILGIDARIITGAISKYYANLLEGAGASGYEYLDKIIQIPFRIPTPNRTEIQDFLSKQMGDPKAPVTESPEDRTAALKRLLDEQTDRVDMAANAAPDTEPVAAPPVRTRAEAAFAYDELRAFQQIADVLRPNPRHLKRLVNVYRLVRTLADYRSASVILDNPAATIRWLVLSAQWSYTSYVMLRCYDDWCEKPAGRAAVVEACGSNDPLLWLYGKVKPGLDPKRQALLDDDPDLLEALLNLPQGRVSWDELDVIRRYTINFNPAVEGESLSANSQISLLES